MQAVAWKSSRTLVTTAVMEDRPPDPPPPEADLPLCDLIRGRSVTLGERNYVEHARDGRAMSFRQLEASMERWRALLGGARRRWPHHGRSRHQ